MLFSRKYYTFMVMCFAVWIVLSYLYTFIIQRQYWLQKVMTTKLTATVESNTAKKVESDFEKRTFWHIPITDIQRASLPIRKSTSQSNEMSFILANSTVAFMACCRNSSTLLPKFRQRVQNIGELFADYYILIGESDSSDDTLRYLRNWSSNDSHLFIQNYDKLDGIFSRRTVRIAFCRNSLLNTARLRGWIQKAQFLIVMDIDINSNEVLSRETFLTNFEYPLNSWAAMTASQSVSIETLQSPIYRFCLQAGGHMLSVIDFLTIAF
ncbi:unnamed protein product [Rotaria sp. Silwood2]|nr:unnamed protein product [Rotaria sp. Silwood2]CAF3027099.1 unnamed protein product [Rotaria sp. Silwood2]CAF3273817.1 unnamed protein product [Rotaria sp. Silwood2]CAF3926331.1 unnamed protein product [Rotaria sp. Silwood2]CAF3930534.1 unnamed protein product [Rotaria sp. Silwood2]